MEQVDKAFGSLQVTENDVISHSTSLFTPPARELTMLDGVTTGYRPISMENDGPFTFIISSAGDKFLALNLTRLYVRGKVVNADGSDLADGADVAITNLFAGSFQNSVSIKIDGQEISGLNNTYMHYKQYAETILSYAFSARKSHLTASGCYTDTPAAFEDLSSTKAGAEGKIPNQNAGFLKRQRIIRNSQTFEMVCPLHSDFTQMDRLFPPGHELSITIYKNTDNFFLHAKKDNGTYKYKVSDLRLFVRHISLMPVISAAIMARAQKEMILFPFNKTTITRHAFSNGLNNAIIPNLIRGSIPKSLVFFMTEEDSADILKKNPYNFQHFDLSSALIRFNGKEIPSERYNLDFENDRYVRLFRDLYDNIGVLHDDTGAFVDFENFKGGYCFIAFDLTPDMCNGFHWHRSKTGAIDAEFTFLKKLPKTIAIYALATYDALLKLDAVNPPILEY